MQKFFVIVIAIVLAGCTSSEVNTMVNSTVNGYSQEANTNLSNDFEMPTVKGDWYNGSNSWYNSFMRNSCIAAKDEKNSPYNY